MSLDLPLIWACILALAVLLYVVFDGFDLGVGILFPFARSPADRDTMMNSIAPVWDGNETWLVLGGGGLFAAFPAAYAVLIPAIYLPIYLMLGALILRGVAFEFRLHGRRRGKKGWTIGFALGSTLAAFAQGLALGGFIQGVNVKDGAFAGGAFDWLTPYTLLVALGLVAGYALLGACWLMWKTADNLHGDAGRWGWIAAPLVGAFLLAVSIATIFVHPHIASRWGIERDAFHMSRFAPLAVIPALGAVGLAVAAFGLKRGSHRLPFLGAVLTFLSGYLGLGVSFFPFLVPYALTYEDAASAPNSLALLLIGVSIMLPMILGYMIWVYWVFRGKVADASYH